MSVTFRRWAPYLIVALLALLCWMAGSLSTQAQARRGWEYKRMLSTMESSSPFGGDKWVKTIGEETFANDVSSESLVNALGAQGWELVSIVSGSHTNSQGWSGITTQYTYYFKRPK